MIRWTAILIIMMIGIHSVWAYDSEQLREFTMLLNLTKQLLSDYRNYNNYKFETYIEEAAALYNLDPNLLKAIIKIESDYDPYAVSPAGAIGLMQLMPATAKTLKVQNPWDPRENIFAGARYYRMLLDRFHGDHFKALLAYHAGPDAVKKGRIPRASYKYAKRVLKTWKKYNKEGGIR